MEPRPEKGGHQRKGNVKSERNVSFKRLHSEAKLLGLTIVHT